MIIRWPIYVFPVLLICVSPQSGLASVAYDYTGSEFVSCGLSCPSNYTTDYIIASITFTNALVEGITVTDNFSSISAWSISDELNYFSFSSNDLDAASELDAVQMTTDQSGNIVDYYLEVSSPDRPAPGYDTAFIQPALRPVGGADYMDVSHGLSEEWAAASNKDGVWSAGVIVTPEPPSLFLSLCTAILLLAVRINYCEKGR